MHTLDCVTSWSKVRLFFSFAVHTECCLRVVDSQNTVSWPKICQMNLLILCFTRKHGKYQFLFCFNKAKIDFAYQGWGLVSRASFVYTYQSSPMIIFMYLKPLPFFCNDTEFEIVFAYNNDKI